MYALDYTLAIGIMECYCYFAKLLLLSRLSNFYRIMSLYHHPKLQSEYFLYFIHVIKFFPGKEFNFADNRFFVA